MGPFTGREVFIAEAARTPFGRSHPEKGWFRDTHPNDLLGAVYRELLPASMTLCWQAASSTWATSHELPSELKPDMDGSTSTAVRSRWGTRWPPLGHG
jgi:hypothetical protein